MERNQSKITLLGLESGCWPPAFLPRAKGILRKAIASGGMTVDEFDAPWDDCPAGQPKAIIALGPAAFKTLTGETQRFEKKRGYIYWNEEWQCKVIGTYHPCYIGRGRTGLIQALIYDLKLAWKKPPGTFPTELLTLFPSTEQFRSWCHKVLYSNPEFIAFDIETPYSSGKPEDDELEEDPSSEIIRISFATPDGRAITVPWVGGYVDTCRELLATPITKLLFNADYDVPRCEVNGCQVNGMLIDVMWLFHFLFPDLPRSLAAVASFYTTLPEWKSLGSKEPELYSALDSHATVLCYLGVRKHLQEKGMWVVAWDHVVRLMAILRKMRKRGLLIHREKLRVFAESLDASLIATSAAIDLQIPIQCHPKEIILAKHLRGRCSCLKAVIGKRGQPTKKFIAEAGCERCSGTGWKPPVEKVLPFNPESGDQVEAYIRSQGHKMPTRRDRDTGETKETTEHKFVQILARQHPEAAYGAILKHRQYNKLATTYAKWPMKDSQWEGLLRVTPRLTQAPATGRLSCVNPNMQNIPKEGHLAEKFKDIIHATPGHLLVKRDYSGIEAVLTGYFAGDSEYMRLALLGVHTYRCAEFKGEAPHMGLGDKELGAALKVLKRTYDTLAPGEEVSLYQRFKKINHMTNYGAKPLKIYNESPGLFKDLAEVRKLYGFLRHKSPKIFAWHQSLARRIPKENYRLVSPYMYNRYFFDLPGDLPKAIAQLPQGTAAAIIKESMLLVDETEDGEFLVLQVHDELVSDFPIAPGSCTCHPSNKWTWQERDARVAAIMERPLLPLGGLRIMTDGTSGDTYLCKEVK